VEGASHLDGVDSLSDDAVVGVVGVRGRHSECWWVVWLVWLKRCDVEVWLRVDEEEERRWRESS
jgi:hypothetical protein